MTASTPHLVALVHRLGPYHSARYSACAAVMRTTVVELSAVDSTYGWTSLVEDSAFDRRVLFRDRDIDEKSHKEIRGPLEALLGELAPDVMAIPGWYSLASLCALSWARVRRVPAIVMSESTEGDFSRSGLREYAKRCVVRQYSSALVGGGPQARYIEKLGLSPKQVSLGYDAVDNDHFSAGADAARERGEELRATHRLPNQYFLASSRFVLKKNLSGLLEGYDRYRKQSTAPWALVILGDGPERTVLEQQILDLGLQGAVELLGFKQYEELPLYYGLAGGFVHASTSEQWGLVVNEAMASGLPVIVSSKVGSAEDLVTPRNGYVFEPTSPDQLAKCMESLSRSETGALAMGEESRKIIRRWGLDRFAAGMQSAVSEALARRVPSSRLAGLLVLAVASRRRPHVQAN